MATSGVKNIRAMFEQKQEEATGSSPPSRGRSPANSDLHSIRSTSSRPVSKIRTSFVAVEKSGSQGIMLGLRRISDVQDKAVEEGDSRPAFTRTASNTGHDSIAEEKEQDKEGSEEKQTGVKENAKVNGSGKADDTQSRAKDVKRVGKTPAGIKTQIKPDSSATKSPASATSKKPITPRDIPDRTKVDARKPTTLATKSSTSTLRTVASKSKLPNASTPTTTAKTAVKRDPVSKPESRTSTPRTSLAGNTGSNDGDSKLVKPRPKSPTRPGRLPAVATKSTTSSAAKSVNDDSETARKDKAKSRPSTDSSFLERLMKPTTASASKTHEKAAPQATSQKPATSKPKRTSDIGSKPASKAAVKTSSKPILKSGVAVSDAGRPANKGEAKPDEPSVASEVASEPEATESISNNDAKVHINESHAATDAERPETEQKMAASSEDVAEQESQVHEALELTDANEKEPPVIAPEQKDNKQSAAVSKAEPATVKTKGDATVKIQPPKTSKPAVENKAQSSKAKPSKTLKPATETKAPAKEEEFLPLAVEHAKQEESKAASPASLEVKPASKQQHTRRSLAHVFPESITH